MSLYILNENETEIYLQDAMLHYIFTMFQLKKSGFLNVNYIWLKLCNFHFLVHKDRLLLYEL